MISPSALTVIVPTCGRPASLARLLRALSAQSGAAPFEVVVVADGVAATRVIADEDAIWPFPVRIIEQPREGAAAARNRGAAAAQSELLLFVDDDVVPAHGVVQAHVGFHAAHPDAIAAGGLEPRSTVGGFLGGALCGWWEAMNEAIADPRHRFSFRDLFTGHCSMRRSTFLRVGGFDTTLRCQEDFDFGYRAIEAGVELRYVRDGRARHHDESDLAKIMRRKYDEGIASVQLSRKHPELRPALPLGRPLADSRAARLVHRAVVDRWPGHQLIAPLLRAAMAATEASSMSDKWRMLLERLMDYWYWEGVRRAAGAATAVRALRAEPAPPRHPLVTIHLDEGLQHAEQQMDALRPHGVRIIAGGETVCELAERPGSERLRGVHLRPHLLKVHAQDVAAALRRAQALPEFLWGLVPGPSRSASDDANRGRAA